MQIGVIAVAIDLARIFATRQVAVAVEQKFRQLGVVGIVEIVARRRIEQPRRYAPPLTAVGYPQIFVEGRI